MLPTIDGNIAVAKAVVQIESDGEQTETDEKKLRSFLKQNALEKENMMALEHPNIIKMLGFVSVSLSEDVSASMLFLEYGGKSLAYYLSDQYQELRYKAIHIAREILNGLIYLHHKDLILGDLKDENIVLDIHSNPMGVRIIDLAYCGTRGGREELDFKFTGTKGFFSPEAKLNKSTNSMSCDIYAYGLICASLSGVERKTRGIPRKFEKRRKNNPEKVNDFLVKNNLSEKKQELCGCTKEALQTAVIVDVEAIQKISSSRGFLRVMAVLATRLNPWLRPYVGELDYYFRAFQRKK